MMNHKEYLERIKTWGRVDKVTDEMVETWPEAFKTYYYIGKLILNTGKANVMFALSTVMNAHLEDLDGEFEYTPDEAYDDFKYQFPIFIATFAKMWMIMQRHGITVNEVTYIHDEEFRFTTSNGRTVRFTGPHVSSELEAELLSDDFDNEFLRGMFNESRTLPEVAIDTGSLYKKIHICEDFDEKFEEYLLTE